MAIPLRRSLIQPIDVPAPATSLPEPVDPLLIATIVYLLVSVVSINEIIPGLLALRPGLIALILASLLYVANAVGRRSVKMLIRQPTAKAALRLFGWMILTIPLVLAPGAVLTFIFEVFITTMVLYILMVAVARGARDLERFTLWYQLGVTIYCTYALKIAKLSMGDSWRMAAVSGLYDANDFAVLCVAGMPLAMHFILRDKRLWVRGASAWGLYVMTVGLVNSGSRGGLIAAAAACAFIFFRYNAVSFGWRVVGIVGVVVIMTTVAGAEYWTQMHSIIEPEEDYNVSSDFGRMAIWKRGIGYSLQFPIAGVGASNFNFAEGTVSEEVARLRESGIDTPWLAPHNTYVQIAAEAGIVGFAMFLAILLNSWRSLARAARDAPTPDLKSLCQAISGSLFGMLVGIFFLTHGYSAMLYGLLALATIAGKVIPKLSGPSGASAG